MYSPYLLPLPDAIQSWRRFVDLGITTLVGNVTASVIVLYERRATPQPQMPIAYLRRTVKLNAAIDPFPGVESTQIPVYNQ